MNAEQIKAAAEWLQQQADNLKFGSVSITLILHNKKISRVEKSVTEKEQAEN